MQQEMKVLIIGGGFAGVKAALILAKKNLPNVTITLVSETPHFEYHASFYRVLAGHTPLEVCIPLHDIFDGIDVNVVEDKVQTIDLEKKVVTSESKSTYKYDYLILGLGSEVNYYGTPGLDKLSFNVQNLSETLRLKRHLHELFLNCTLEEKDEKNCSAHIIVVGGGPNGVEVAGALSHYARDTAKRHGIDPSFVTIDLIQSASRLLPNGPEEVSEEVRKRLHSLGINIFLNRRLMKEELDKVYLKDMELKTKTLIWTAGVCINSLYRQIKGLVVNDTGRVEVDEHLNPAGHPEVFIVGDGAATKTSGMAIPALMSGEFSAETISRIYHKQKLVKYESPTPQYVTPVGEDWAAASIGSFNFFGTLAWWYKRLCELEFYMNILPFSKAWVAFQEDSILWESCPICSEQLHLKEKVEKSSLKSPAKKVAVAAV